MKRPSSIADFGKRLAELRKTRGLTQEVLGQKIGVSKRVIAYYEGETKFPPAHLIIPLSKTLHASTDELLGVKQIKELHNPEHAALWRKLKKIELLPKKDQKALLHYLDALLQKIPQDSTPFKVPSLHEAAQRRIKVG